MLVFPPYGVSGVLSSRWLFVFLFVFPVFSPSGGLGEIMYKIMAVGAAGEQSAKGAGQCFGPGQRIGQGP